MISGYFFRIESAGDGDVLEALRLRKEAGLLTNDALLLDVARRLNCEAVASADKAIVRAPGFKFVAPADIRRRLPHSGTSLR